MKNQSVRGRRPGQSDTRERILATAKQAFLAEGYQAVSLRSIASSAGVDVALLSYFFGSKQGLFSAALALPVDPATVLQAALAGDDEGLAERILRGMLRAWEDPASGEPLRAMAGAATTEPALGRLVREAVGSQLVERLSQRLGGADSDQRAAVFSAQISGLVFSRYLLRLEPIASMSPDEVVRYLLPALRTSLEGPTPS
jgi:AcrR family transcriptional regulator